MTILQKIQSKDKIRDKKTRRLIKSSQERYMNVKTGQIISRRERDKIVKQYKKMPLQKMRLEKETKIYQRLRQDYIAKEAQKGKAISLRAANLDPELKKIIKDLEKGAKLRKAGKHKEGDKLIRDALEKTNRRDGIGHDIIPGESPKAGLGMAA